MVDMRLTDNSTATKRARSVQCWIGIADGAPTLKQPRVNTLAHKILHLHPITVAPTTEALTQHRPISETATRLC